MNIDLSPTQIQLLERLAQQQNHSLDEIIHEAIDTYLAARIDSTSFRAQVERIMSEHQWLLAELAKR